MYGEEILDEYRLNPNTNLSNPESDGYKLIDNTIGWLISEYMDSDLVMETFIGTAKGAYLDFLGRMKGIYRNNGESDDDYRSRIINLDNLKFSKADLESIGCEIFCYVKEIDKQVTSSNPLLSRKYLVYADTVTMEWVDKFINNRVFEYLEDL
jgi:hypothetical protein